MANVKISDLSAASTPLSGTEEVPVVQSGVTKKATTQDIVDLASTTINAVENGGATPKIISGLLSNRPASDTTGTIYVCTESSYEMYQYNGATWDQLNQIPQYIEDGGGTPKIISGTLSSRPLADTIGTIYVCTDSSYEMYQYNGSGWDQLNQVSGYVEDGGGTPKIISDTFANRPASDTTGTIFVCTDSPYAIYQYSGSVWNELSVSGQSIQTVKVTLSSSDILSLGTAKTLVNAPGSGKMLDVLKIKFRMNAGATPYSTNTTIQCYYGDPIVNTTVTGTLNILGASSTEVSRPALNDVTSASINGNFVNTAITIRTLGGTNPTAGNGTLDVYITYQEITL